MFYIVKMTRLLCFQFYRGSPKCWKTVRKLQSRRIQSNEVERTFKLSIRIDRAISVNSILSYWIISTLQSSIKQRIQIFTLNIIWFQWTAIYCFEQESIFLFNFIRGIIISLNHKYDLSTDMYFNHFIQIELYKILKI